MPEWVEIKFVVRSPASPPTNDREIKLWETSLFLPRSSAPNPVGLTMPHKEKRHLTIRKSAKIPRTQHDTATNSVYVE